MGFGSCSDNDLERQQMNGWGVVEGIGTPATHYVKDGQIVPYTDSQVNAKKAAPTNAHRWSNDSMSWVDMRSVEQVAAIEAEGVRMQRDRFLAETDWTDTLSAKSRLGDTLYQAWQDYRQALRDITNQPGFPSNVVWPESPQ